MHVKIPSRSQLLNNETVDELEKLVDEYEIADLRQLAHRLCFELKQANDDWVELMELYDHNMNVLEREAKEAKLAERPIEHWVKAAREYPRYRESATRPGKRLVMSYKPKKIMNELANAVEYQQELIEECIEVAYNYGADQDFGRQSSKQFVEKVIAECRQTIDYCRQQRAKES